VAVPALTTYSVAAGQPIHGGRWAGGRLSSGVELDAILPAGTLAAQQSDVGGDVTLDVVAPSGSMEATAVPTFVEIWGQSNAMGQTYGSDISAAPLSGDAGLATYYAGIFSRVYIWTGAAFAQLDPDSNNQTGAGLFGPEFGLAVEWMRNTTSGNLYLLKNAAGSQSIDAFESTAGAMYLQGKAEHDEAEAWFVSNGVTISQRGMVWVQGEADMGMTEAWYRARLDALVTAWDADGIAVAPNPILLWQMDPSSASYGAGVYAAKAAAAAASPGHVTAPALPYYMRADNVHLNGRGMVNLGYSCASVICGFPLETI
jgi:hypothetical protein